LPSKIPTGTLIYRTSYRTSVYICVTYYYIILLWDYKTFKNHINPQRNDVYQEQYAIIVYLLIQIQMDTTVGIV